MLVNEVYEGDCLDVMREFPDNCIDSIITDPPYGLEFMGKDWDYGIPGVAYWREALRIAKPGATLMVFGGSRTYHRLTCAIEDAGWEIRDCIMWVYGSGFPKSHDVSKGIDKAAGVEREVSDLHHNPGGNGGYQKQSLHYQKNGKAIDGRNSEKIKARLEKDVFITAPATPLAAKFDGYGTALKPAHEPIVLAMKPIDQSFAANAEKWGLSGLNIDGGRVETNGESLIRPVGNGSVNAYEWSKNPNPMHGQPTGSPQGRFPSNVIHDGSEEVMAEFDKAGVRTSGAKKLIEPKNKADGVINNGRGFNTNEFRIHNDKTVLEASTGSAARFFQQCPPDPPQSNPCLDCTDCIIETEAPKGRWPANVIHDGSEEVMAEFDKAGVRTTGGPGITQKNDYSNSMNTGSHRTRETIGYSDSGSAARFFQQCPPDPTAHPEAARFRYCPKAGKRERGNGNNHPTVKPLSLLRYLAKLTRPPDGGIVLDPFGGSGTTALACIAEGRDYIIIEKEPEYAELCRRRIAEYSGKEIAPVEVKVESDVVKQMSLW